MIKNDKKGLRARLNDIYEWSVKSGVAIATSNSLKVQWDKVIEELNELLYHCNGNGCRESLNARWKEAVIDDIGDILISFINLLNINPKKIKGTHSKNEKRMSKAEKLLLKKVRLTDFSKAQAMSDEMYIIDRIFDFLHFAYLNKGNNLSDEVLFDFLSRLTYLFELIKFKFGIKISLRNCIYASYCEIQSRRYEIRVR